MSSIISGYEYDIFISYRQKDNKGDHWVTEFVNALKTEIESTFKEDISIYFDENPHDGLLETHNVDKSLEGKLKCLVFIPIISQTYCDPKSFAWQQEFCAFNKLANEDQFGRDIKLNNGNVASRILPIKIHDLEAADRSFLENELGSVLRSIEFIYKSAGVNRPLKPKDDELHDNDYKTVYRNQVNKVANAIKETIYSIKNPNRAPQSKSLLGFDAIEEWPKKSVAVLPFVNMSNDPDQEYFSDGISEEILNLIAPLSGLLVAARTSSFHFKGKNEDIREIGARLNVEFILEGSVRKSGDQIRITAQIIQVSTGYHLWSARFDRVLHDVFAVQDEIAQSIVEVLKIKLTPGQTISNVQKGLNVEAHNHVLQAMFFANKGGPDLLKKAIHHYKKATEIDSHYAGAYAGHANTLIVLAYYGLEPYPDIFKRAENAAMEAVRLDPSGANGLLALARINFAYKWNFDKSDRLFQQAISLNPNDTESLMWYGDYLKSIGRFEDAKTLLLKATLLNPFSLWAQLFLSHTYFSLNESLAYMRQTEKILSMDPEFLPVFVDLSAYYGQHGRKEDAIENWLSAGKIKFPLYWNNKDSHPEEGVKKRLEYIVSTTNKIRHDGFLSAIDDIIVCLLQDNYEKAVDVCYQIYNEKAIWVPWLKHHILFQFTGLQGNPRFQKLIDSLNFPAI